MRRTSWVVLVLVILGGLIFLAWNAHGFHRENGQGLRTGWRRLWRTSDESEIGKTAPASETKFSEVLSRGDRAEKSDVTSTAAESSKDRSGKTAESPTAFPGDAQTTAEPQQSESGSAPVSVKKRTGLRPLASRDDLIGEWFSKDGDHVEFGEDGRFALDFTLFSSAYHVEGTFRVADGRVILTDDESGELEASEPIFFSADGSFMSEGEDESSAFVKSPEEKG